VVKFGISFESLNGIWRDLAVQSSSSVSVSAMLTDNYNEAAVMLIDDNDEVEEETLCLLTVAALLVTAAETAHLFRNEQRRPPRNYLTRSDLPPNPRFGTAWNHLSNSQSNWAFITTMGLDVEMFNLILNSGFEESWLHQPIPRYDTESLGDSRPSRRSLDASGVLARGWQNRKN
jgi:hypothetical protein